MKKILFCLLLLQWLCSSAQVTTEKTVPWPKQSLASRATPQWFNDAKLGIFIHWGLYSVPAWATPTTTPDKVTDWKAFYTSNPYAEWYLNSLRIAASPTQIHHQKVYGSTFNYYSFKDSFLQQSKNLIMASWANLFAKIGAKYVVFTTKHHDGFTLYPSTIINPFKSSAAINSPRDFVGELSKSVRDKGMKFGVYYSGGLDWTFNEAPVTNLWPDLFESMPSSVGYSKYADSQYHELINKYQPDILWNDVNYPKNGDLPGIFSKLVTLNPQAVINDRWQQFPELANFSTPEYTVLNEIATHKWETCRGLGYSFGYNQIEGDKELLSSKSLIELLIDVVSKNGNLLLNVGPKADGTIPENQLKRLVDLGNWMSINSEGIYATTPYKIASAKLKDSTELRFTKKGNDLYIFLFSKPKSSSIFIPYSNSSQLSKVFLYGKNRKKLAYKVTRKGLTIRLPNNVDFGFAQMIKVTSSIKL